ncbi:hypothetical protein HK102_003481 [Quaeritorhiza haematococci]|nr:hypothetical protein HK102_003481 [Quaeritorhiza haematococci]
MSFCNGITSFFWLLANTVRPQTFTMRIVFLALLLCTLHVRWVASAPTIRAFDANGRQLFEVGQNQQPRGNYLVFEAVKTLLVGNGPNILEVWVPWNYGPIADGKPFVFATAMYDIIAANPDFTGKVTIVGWDAVENNRICDGTDGGDCPDVVVLGTSQIPTRYYRGDLEPMEQYFSDYAEATGLVLIDDLYKGTYYDYKIADKWLGVPLVTEAHALFYNKTTLANLGLMPPPPASGSTWEPPTGVSWNLDEFLEYANAMNRSTRSPAFQILSSGDDEINMMMPIVGRFANTFLVTSNNTCGLRKQRWYDTLEKYIRQPLQSGLARYVINTTAMNNNRVVQDFLINKDPNSDVLSQLDAIKALGSLSDGRCPDMNGIGIAPVSCIFSASLRSTEIGYAYPPGFFTYLGGSGAFIPKNSKNKRLAWNVITQFINQANTYLVRINNEGLPPPLESFIDHQQYRTADFYTFSIQLMQRAVPVQYPSNPYTDWPGLKTYKPFRMMFLEMMYKGFDAKVATERACQLVDFLFARECGPQDYRTVISECLKNNTKIMSYVWSPNSTCKNESFLQPEPIYDIECSYVVPDSAFAIGIGVITGLGAFASTLYTIGFLAYRKKPAVMAASVEFSLIIFLGSILTYTSVFLQSGAPSKQICIARPWFLALGFGTFFGGFLIKMMRVDAIFTAGRAGRRVDAKSLSLFSMLQKLAFILLLEIGALIALSIVGSPDVIETTIDLRGVGSYTQQECQAFNQITVVVLLIVNAGQIIYGCYIAWRSRNVPDAFNETRFVMVAILLISFTAIVIIPVTMTLNTARGQYLLTSLAINFATTVATGIFAIPKLWAAYNNIAPQTSDFKMSAVNSDIPTSSAGGATSTGDAGNMTNDTRASATSSMPASLHSSRAVKALDQ